MGWKRHVRIALEQLGLHVRRQRDNPAHNLLGLRECNFRSVLDIGAHAGQFARFASRNFPAAKLYCFEPMPAPFAQLSAWARGSANVQAINAALGDVEQTATMFVHTDHTYSSSLLKTTDLSSELYPMTKSQQAIPISVKRLDDIVLTLSPVPLEPILIKLDVQGFEGRVIEGGRQTLSRAAACIVEISLDTLYEQQSTFKEIFTWMDGLGFRYAGNLDQVYAADGHVIYLDAVFRR